MKLVNLLVISSLFLMQLAPRGPVQNPCKEIRATVEVTPSTGKNDGAIKVTIEGNSRDFRLYLIAKQKENNRINLPVEEIKSLAPGDYDLVIAESKEGEYCPKRIKVAIP